MLFNSYIFIFVFLPLTFFGYFFINKNNILYGRYYLIFTSLFFYSWWNIIYLPLIISSIFINYFFSKKINTNHKNKKLFFILGIILNISLLAYFKYADFFIQNTNYILSSNIELLHLALPLAISFFTLQQVAFLVDSYKGLVDEKSFSEYALFVTFFPQLIAGPIVHHKEMMPQFNDLTNRFINYKHIASGLFIFSIGLFKKVVLADSFSQWANAGFTNTENLNMIEAWVTSLSYTFQLYFDFSGYTDMAIGIALLFNIRLPINFNSPYKSKDIQDFWRRWHITLSRFLRDYIYIPLGGNKVAEYKVNLNLFSVFLIGGIWHGAGWTFIIWGAMHGIALCIHRLWKKLGFHMGDILAWFITFNFINITWVVFRANTLEDASNLLKSMFFGNIILNHKWHTKLTFLHGKVEFGAWLQHISATTHALYYLFAAIIITLFFKNSQTLLQNLKPNYFYLTFGTTIFIYAILNMHRVSEFLYYNF